jgi:hypothetical protein
VSDLPKGTQITVDLSDLPKSSFADKMGQNLGSLRLEYIAPAGLVIVMLALIAIALLRRKRLNRLGTVGAAGLTAVQESQTLRHMIAELELNFKSGSIGEDDYLRRRRVLESRLSSVAGS